MYWVMARARRYSFLQGIRHEYLRYIHLLQVCVCGGEMILRSRKGMGGKRFVMAKTSYRFLLYPLAKHASDHLKIKYR